METATTSPTKATLPNFTTLTLAWRWRVAARAGWVCLTGFLWILLLMAIPQQYDQLTQPLSSKAAPIMGVLTALQIQWLAEAGISVSNYAIFFILLEVVQAFANLIVGTFIVFQKRLTLRQFYIATTLVFVSITAWPMLFALVINNPHHQPYIETLHTLGVASAFTLFYLFPNGRFIARWTRNSVILMFISLILLRLFVPHWLPVYILAGDVTIERIAATALNGFWCVLGIVALIHRFHGKSSMSQRRQFQLILIVLFFLIVFLLLYAFHNLLTGIVYPASELTVLITFSLFVTVLFLCVMFPVFIGVSIVQHHLFNIDVIIQRTLVYGSLTGLVIGIYVVVIGVLSALFQTSGNLLVSLITTGIVAVLFQPLKQFLQNRIAQLLFGDRHNPFQVILKLSERLESSAAPGTLLPSIAETVAQALKLRYVSIALAEGDQLKTDAVYGQPADGGRITTLPLMYGQETVGQMVIGQGTDDRALDAAERQLWENIAQQTGIAVHAVRLSQALQQSRQQIITAREEERRRLRRDLHDGLGPSLAAHTIKVGTAKLLLESNPQTAAAILTDLETSLGDSLTDIRRLVYNLRPPALDQLGLVGALRDFIQQCSSKTNITLNVIEPLPPLPAAVEVAAYRIVQEAVTNVLRHANAAQCDVNIHLGTDLLISIQDDGVGLAPDAKHGIGLKSMQERAQELGGRFTLESRAGCTCIQVHLPILSVANGEEL